METETMIYCYCVQGWASHGFLLWPELKPNPGESILRDAFQWEAQYSPQHMTKGRKGSSDSLRLLSMFSRYCEHHQQVSSAFALIHFYPLKKRQVFLPFNCNLDRAQFNSRQYVKTHVYSWGLVNHLFWILSEGFSPVYCSCD